MDGFQKYDFAGSEAWKAYLKTVEVPTGESEMILLKLKAKFYKKNVDPDFDISAAVRAKGEAPKPSPTGGTAASASRARPSAGSDTGAAGAQPRSSAPPPSYSGYGASASSYGAGGSAGTYGNERWQRWLFFMHTGLLLLSVFILVPFLPYSRLAYVTFMRLTTVTFATKIFLRFGRPPIRPFNMLSAWFQRVMPTTDFLQVLIAVTFANQPPMVLVAAPAVVLAAYHADAYAAAHLQRNPLWQRYGSRLHSLLLSRQQDALLLNAFCEIATAFMLVLHLLTPARSFLTLMLYGQLLKLKLHMPDSAAQHRQVWRMIDEKTLPYRRHVPALERLIQLAVNWFSSVPTAAR